MEGSGDYGRPRARNAVRVPVSNQDNGTNSVITTSGPESLGQNISREARLPHSSHSCVSAPEIKHESLGNPANADQDHLTFRAPPLAPRKAGSAQLVDTAKARRPYSKEIRHSRDQAELQLLGILLAACLEFTDVALPFLDKPGCFLF